MQMWQKKDNGSHCAIKTDSDSTGQKRKNTECLTSTVLKD